MQHMFFCENASRFTYLFKGTTILFNELLKLKAMVRGNFRAYENACLISLRFRARTEYRAKSDCKGLHKTPNNGFLLFPATKRLKRNLAKQQGVKSKKFQRLFCRLPFHNSVLSHV